MHQVNSSESENKNNILYDSGSPGLQCQVVPCSKSALQPQFIGSIMLSGVLKTGIATDHGFCFLASLAHDFRGAGSVSPGYRYKGGPKAMGGIAVSQVFLDQQAYVLISQSITGQLVPFSYPDEEWSMLVGER